MDHRTATPHLLTDATSRRSAAALSRVLAERRPHRPHAPRLSRFAARLRPPLVARRRQAGLCDVGRVPLLPRAAGGLAAADAAVQGGGRQLPRDLHPVADPRAGRGAVRLRRRACSTWRASCETARRDGPVRRSPGPGRTSTPSCGTTACRAGCARGTRQLRARRTRRQRDPHGIDLATCTRCSWRRRGAGSTSVCPLMAKHTRAARRAGRLRADRQRAGRHPRLVRHAWTTTPRRWASAAPHGRYPRFLRGHVTATIATLNRALRDRLRSASPR